MMVVVSMVVVSVVMMPIVPIVIVITPRHGHGYGEAPGDVQAHQRQQQEANRSAHHADSTMQSAGHSEPWVGRELAALLVS